MTLYRGPVLIVGQGIAGTTLAWQCYFHDVPFTIMDDGHRTSSSLAAAGLFNPLILKRRKLAWRASAFFDALEPFYTRVKEHLGVDCYHPVGIWRRMSNAEEANDWQMLKDKNDYDRFLGIQSKDLTGQEALDSPFGYQEVLGAGYVDVPLYLELSRQFFEKLDSYRKGSFDLEDFMENDAQDYQYIVLARGIGESDTEHYLGEIPFSPAKGHTMEIHCPGLQLSHLISGPCFVIPLGSDRYRIGSTYSWSRFDEGVEEAEIQKLRESFESICSCEYEVTDTWSGIRPATKDRRPLIGKSKVNERVLLFNGFGSRAIMTTPLLAEHLLSNNTSASSFWHEVSYDRYLDK